MSEPRAAPSFEQRLEAALDRYEQWSGRRPEMAEIDPRHPGARAAYQAFGQANHRITIAPSRGQWLAFENGLKPMLRLVVDATSWPALERSCHTRGYATRALDGLVEESPSTGQLRPVAVPAPDLPACRVVLIGRDPDRIQEGEKVEMALRARGQSKAAFASRCRRLGELLGYPACCASSFAMLGGKPHNHDAIRAAARRSYRFDALLNNLSLSMVHTIGWFPCRYDCPASLAIARAVHGHLRRQYPRQLPRALRIWQMPRLYLDERRQLIFPGADVRGTEIRYRAVHAPFAFDRISSNPMLDWIFYVDIVCRVARARRLVVSDVGLVLLDELGSPEEITLKPEPILLPFA